MARSETHDSGLYLADLETKRRFSRDLLNLTIDRHGVCRMRRPATGGIKPKLKDSDFWADPAKKRPAVELRTAVLREEKGGFSGTRQPRMRSGSPRPAPNGEPQSLLSHGRRAASGGVETLPDDIGI